MRTVNDLDAGVDKIEERQEALDELTAIASRVKNVWEMERFKALANPDLRDKDSFPNAESRDAEVSKTPLALAVCPVCDGTGTMRNDTVCAGCAGSGEFTGTIGELGGYRRTYEHARDTAKELLRSEADRVKAIQTSIRVVSEAV